LLNDDFDDNNITYIMPICFYIFCFSDQLIILLLNFDDIVAISSTLKFLQNDFQRIKYPFVLISQAFIGLILIHTNATKAYYSKLIFITVQRGSSKVNTLLLKKYQRF